ncbi:MAG: amidohydrolase family protein [Gemmatimonadota bacterium]
MNIFGTRARGAWRPTMLALSSLVIAGLPAAAQQADSVLAIVGATLIDGNGGAAVPGAVVLVSGGKIRAVGGAGVVKVPKGARVIDAAGKYLVPGFIDTNVHMSLYSGLESLARYEDRFTDIAIEGAQLQLKYGITSVRDSYGMLKPLREARQRIDRGEVPGARLLFAGNIVGWGGPWSYSFTGTRQENLSLFQEQMNDAIAAGGGEELMNMTPDALRGAINRYLDQGVDFVKYGGTSHAFFPAMLGFSEAAQRAIVEETHKRGKVAETHSTSPEGLRLAVEAGVDLVQHPEATDALISPEIIRLMVTKGVICSMLENTITGKPWTDFQKKLKTRADSVTRADSARVADSTKVAASGDSLHSWADSTTAELRLHRPTRAKTLAEVARDSSDQRMLFRRKNAEELIRAGCISTASTDNYRGTAPEFERVPRSENQAPGIGTILAIEGLVELGMSPPQAIVAATKNGALAMRMSDRLGTIEPGKIADLLLLGADPLADIHNIRKLATVIKDGRIVDVGKLPLRLVFYKPVAMGR